MSGTNVGVGQRFTVLFGKNYVWVRDEMHKLHLKRIHPQAIITALEEAAINAKRADDEMSARKAGLEV